MQLLKRHTKKEDHKLASRIRSTNPATVFGFVRCCYNSALELTCFRLRKGSATFSQPETFFANFLHLMVLFSKWFSTMLKRHFGNGRIMSFIIFQQPGVGCGIIVNLAELQAQAILCIHNVTSETLRLVLNLLFIYFILSLKMVGSALNMSYTSSAIINKYFRCSFLC